jgi:hypothetical protein
VQGGAGGSLKAVDLVGGILSLTRSRLECDVAAAFRFDIGAFEGLVTRQICFYL